MAVNAEHKSRTQSLDGQDRLPRRQRIRPFEPTASCKCAGSYPKLGSNNSRWSHRGRWHAEEGGKKQTGRSPGFSSSPAGLRDEMGTQALAALRRSRPNPPSAKPIKARVLGSGTPFGGWTTAAV